MAASQVGSGTVEDMDEDDDIILVMEEKTAPETTGGTILKTADTFVFDKDSKSLKFCGDVKEQIKAASKEIEVTESEIVMMSQELKSVESELGETVYERLKFLVENPNCTVLLDVDEDAVIDMITEQLDELDVAKTLSQKRTKVVHEKLCILERANQSVSKMLLECHTKLKSYGQALTAESDIVSEEIDRYEKILHSSTINIDDDDDVDNDSDDDVKIVDDPSSQRSSVPKCSAAVPIPSPSLPGSSQQLASQGQEDQSKFSTPSTSKGALSAEIPSIEQLRSQFASVVNSQMSGLLTTLTAQQDHSTSPLPAQFTQQPADHTFWPTLLVGDKILGKKFNDVWYGGTILDLSAPSDPEWRCRVKFDGKGLKYLSAKHVAYKDSIKSVVRVGTRVVALYREEDAPSTFYAGIIAEAPSMKNNKRFLVFFDDGYAQYCQAAEIHKVYKQSENVWEDIHPDTSSFIKEYLDIYPERPMVRLAKGQVVRTEWNGKWWTAKVLEIDASLVKMVFQSDRRTEWIYRGSTRLEPLFRALTNANAIKAAGTSRGRRLNLTMKPSTAHNRPSVEYTRGFTEENASASASTSQPKAATAAMPTTEVAAIPAAAPSGASKVKTTLEPPKKRANMAKKSTGGLPEFKNTLSKEAWQAPWVKYQRKAQAEMKKAAALQQPDQEQAVPKGKVYPQLTNVLNRKLSSDYASLLQEKLAKNMDQMEYDEERAMGKRMELRIDSKGRPRTKFELHSCGPACIKGIDDDPDKFKGQSQLLIPLNCAWERHVCKARPMAKRFVLYRTPCGRRLRCIEDVDKYLVLTNSYLTIDFFTFDHHLHVCTEFVPVKTFCDIKDLSYGKENYPVSCVNGLDRQYPDYLEYSSFRIPTQNVHLNLDTDFLACCDCKDNCRDRSKCACQQLTIHNTSCIGPVDPSAGYQYRRLREPLFTGIYECNSRCGCDKRCHNRVAQLGLRTRLQVFKTEKKGWGLRSLDDISKGSFICIYAGQLLTDKGANEDGKQYGDEYLAELDFIEVVEGQKEGYESDVEFSDDHDDKNYTASKDSEDSDFSMNFFVEGLGERRSSRHRKTKGSKPETASTVAPPKAEEEKTPKETSASTPINISDDEDGDDKDRNAAGEEKAKELNLKKEESPPVSAAGKAGTSQSSSMAAEKAETSQSPPIAAGKEQTSQSPPIAAGKEQTSQSPIAAGKEQTSQGPVDATPGGELQRRAKKSTGGSRLNLSVSLKSPETGREKDESKCEKKVERAPTRSYFHDNTECYIMDAKSMGNLGRYLNHSCTPNVFVQNIFVDTHDLRFPWVSFFAGRYIRAGTELTWDYNYEVGSVPNKVMYCYCGTSLCRGRLL